MLCKVSIVDDHALFRRGVLDILRQTEEYEIVAEYSSGKAFLAKMQEEYPELLLLDVQMPDESGLNILKEIRKIDQQLKVVVLTASEDDEIVLEAIRSGANGFLPKDTLPEVIVENLREVRKGQTKQETVTTSWQVLAVVVVASILLWCFDYILGWLMKFIIG